MGEDAMSYSRVIREHEKVNRMPLHDKRGIVSKIFSRGDKPSGLMMELSGTTIRSYAPASGNTLLRCMAKPRVFKSERIKPPFVTEYNEIMHNPFIQCSVRING